MNSGDQSQVGRLGGKCFGPLNHLEGSAVLLLICWGAVFPSDDTFFYLLNSSGPFPTSHQRFQPSVFLVTAMLTAVPFSFIRIIASQNIHSVPVIGTESVEQLAWYLHHFCPACKEIHSIKSPKILPVAWTRPANSCPFLLTLHPLQVLTNIAVRPAWFIVMSLLFECVHLRVCTGAHTWGGHRTASGVYRLFFMGQGFSGL